MVGLELANVYVCKLFRKILLQTACILHRIEGSQSHKMKVNCSTIFKLQWYLDIRLHIYQLSVVLLIDLAGFMYSMHLLELPPGIMYVNNMTQSL